MGRTATQRRAPRWATSRLTFAPSDLRGEFAHVGVGHRHLTREPSLPCRGRARPTKSACP
jgi:hypothetical protein